MNDEWDAFRVQEPEPAPPPPQEPVASANDEWAAFRAAPEQQDEWAAFRVEPPEAPPEAEGMLATAARAFGHEAPAVVAGAAGAMYGAGVGSLAGPWGTVGGAITGAVAGGFGGAAAAGKAKEWMGVDDSIQVAINAKANPWSAAIGQGAAQILGFGAGAAGTAARVAGAGIGLGIEGGMQAYQGEFDPAKLTAQGVAGAVFTNPYKWGERAQQAGAKAGGQLAAAGNRVAERINPPEYGPHQPYGPQQPYGPPPPPDYHGSGAPKTSVGVSETPAPPPEDLTIGLREDNKPGRSERTGYDKDARPTVDDGSSQVHVGGVDPDLAHAIQHRTAAAPPEMQGPRQPEGPPEFQGPRQPYGPPEMQGPPPPQQGPPEFQGPRQPFGPPEQQGPPAPPPAPPPVAEPPPGPVRQPAKKGANTDNMDVLEYLASQGGIRLDPHGELAQLLDGRNPTFARFGSLVRKGGKTEDEALRSITADAPYIHDEGAQTGGQNQTTVNDLRDMIDRALRGEKIYQIGKEPPAAKKAVQNKVDDENLNNIYYQVDDLIENYGANPAFREPMVKLMVKEGIDAETAHDRVMEMPPEAYAKSTNVLPTYEAGAEGKPQAVMPGFEQAGQGEMAQRGADKGLQAKAPQQFGGEGLFGDGRLADVPDEMFMRRGVIERGRSGRPIRTEPLPIGSEEGIIKAGLEKVENTPRPDVDAPPVTEAMARKGPTMSREELEALTAGAKVTKVEPSRRLQGKTLTAADLQKEGQSPINKAEAPPAPPKQSWFIVDAEGKKIGEAPTRGDAMKEMNALKKETSRQGSKQGWRVVDSSKVAEPAAPAAAAPPKTEADLAREGGQQPQFVGAQTRKRTPEELAQPFTVQDRMLEGKQVPAFAKMMKDKGEGGSLLREAVDAFNAAVKTIKDAGYNPGDFAIRNIPELADANKAISNIGGSISRLVTGAGKKTVDPARLAKDIDGLRETLVEAKRPYAEKKAEIDAAVVQSKETFVKADELRAASDKRIAELTDTHSRAVDSAIDTIERAVEAGNKDDVLKAAKAARDALKAVPKEVIKDDPEFWGQFKSLIGKMTKPGYETATQQAAREGDANAQKILDTGVDPTFKGDAPTDKNLKTAVKEACGDCFKAAYAQVKANPENTLVHGLVTQGDRRFPHAWTEDANGMVHETSNGQNIVMPKADYYAKFDVNPTNPNEFKTYPHGEALVKSVRNKHYGPWEISEAARDVKPKEAVAKVDPVEAASDKILKDMGITPDEKGGKRDASIVGEREFDPVAGEKVKIKGDVAAADAKTKEGDFYLEKDHVKDGWVVKRGDEVISEHPNKGQAYIGLNKAAKGQPVTAKGTPSPLSPTGGQAAPPANVGAAVQQGGGAPPAHPPGGGQPPVQPPGGGGGGQPNQPNAGHTPPVQRGWWHELLRDVQRKVGAHLLGPEGMAARMLFRGAYGENYRVAEQTAKMLKDHQETIRAMSRADRVAMIDVMQGGTTHQFIPTAKQRAFMDAHERAMQEWEGKLHQLPDELKIQFLDNYMAQMYENPGHAPGVFAGAGKRGGAGSTKHRKFATYEEARQAGLIPKYDDPIEISTRYINSIKDFVASRQVIERGEFTGSIGYFKNPQAVGATGGPSPLIKGGPPPGWKKLDTPGKGGKDAYAPEDFADTFNNFYGKGFGQSDKSRNVYEAVRNSTNAWTQLELGINAYHMFTMANEAIISDVGGALNKLFQGDIKGAGRSLAHAPMAPRARYLEGKIFQKEYLDPNSTNPIATILAEAGARPVGRGHAADYTFQDRGSFINKFDARSIQSELRQAGAEISKDFADAMAGTAGQKALFPLRQAGRALQTVAAPIFDKYIPALKAGAVHGQMKDWHEAMIAKNPAFDMVGNPADRRVAVNAAMKIVDSVDNRFGEMIHDNMFMNATLKQSAQVAMRSFSWAIGAVKEIGGGTAATGKALYKLAESKGANNRFDMTNPEWDPRMSYAIAFPFVLATISSVYQMLRAGEKPEGWRDLYAPKTGGMTPGVGGRGLVKEHVLMPGYQKDVMGWTHHPLQEMYNKLGGLPQTLIEQSSGKDWKGAPIVRHNATLPEVAADRMAHLFTKLGPISVKNMVKGTEPTSNISRVETALGFRAPGAFIQDPEGYQRAMDRKSKNEWRTKEKRERKIELRQNPGG